MSQVYAGQDTFGYEQVEMYWATEEANKRRIEGDFDLSQGFDYHEYVHQSLIQNEKFKRRLTHSGNPLPKDFHLSCMEFYLPPEKIMRLNHELSDYLISKSKNFDKKSALQKVFHKEPRVDQNYVYNFNGFRSLVIGGLDELALVSFIGTFFKTFTMKYLVELFKKRSSCNVIAGNLEQIVTLLEDKNHMLWYFTILIGKRKMANPRAFQDKSDQVISEYLSNAIVFLEKQEFWRFNAMENKTQAADDYFDHLVFGTWYVITILSTITATFHRKLSVKTCAKVVKMIFQKTVEDFRFEVMVEPDREYFFTG